MSKYENVTVNPSIFKAYDIRGIYPGEINEEIAYRIGRAFVVLLQGENKDRKLKLAVARDMRISSPELFKAVVRGVTDQGADVVDIGIASTPTFYFAVGKYGYDGGLQISASHNPKEYNGVKMVRHHAIPVSGDTGILKICNMVIKNEFKDARKKGVVEQRDDVLKEQMVHDLKYADLKKIKAFRIVADPANATGILFLEELFKHLPCKLIRMNFDLDGTFPAHQPDPLQDKNMVDLKQRVLKEKADLGIAPDGDGDRIFFVDDKGETLPPEILRGMMAQVFLKDHPGAKICYDARPGRITEDMIIEAGGVPILTKVGHSLIKETMIKEGAVFAGESSGHFFLKTEQGTFEVPMIIILKLLEMMSESGKPLSEIVKPYRKYFHSGEINEKVADKEAKIREVEASFKDADKVLHLDGLSVFYKDFWFNVRSSNTEPLLRLNLEARTKEKMEQMRDKILGMIRS